MKRKLKQYTTHPLKNFFADFLLRTENYAHVNEFEDFFDALHYQIEVENTNILKPFLSKQDLVYQVQKCISTLKPILESETFEGSEKISIIHMYSLGFDTKYFFVLLKGDDNVICVKKSKIPSINFFEAFILTTVQNIHERLGVFPNTVRSRKQTINKLTKLPVYVSHFSEHISIKSNSLFTEINPDIGKYFSSDSNVIGLTPEEYKLKKLIYRVSTQTNFREYENTKTLTAATYLI